MVTLQKRLAEIRELDMKELDFVSAGSDPAPTEQPTYSAVAYVDSSGNIQYTYVMSDIAYD